MNELCAHNVTSADGSQQPVCEVFSALTHDSVKNRILSTFTDQNSHIRIVIASIAFGMGLDAPDVVRIIHWGPSSGVEAYVQETGRCGRNGTSSEVLLYFSPTDVSAAQPITESMKAYCLSIVGSS